MISFLRESTKTIMTDFAKTNSPILCKENVIIISPFIWNWFPMDRYRFDASISVKQKHTV